MQLATWGTYRFKADAQKCADEIMEICEELESATPQQILEKARDGNTQAFKKAFTETFITFFKDSTGKKGTDIKRSLSMTGSICPVDFESVEVVNNIVPTSGISASPVLCSSNVFHNWRTTIEVSCPDIVFPHETVLQLIETSGKYIGIGTQRANGNGRYHINPENVTIS